VIPPDDDRTDEEPLADHEVDDQERLGDDDAGDDPDDEAADDDGDDQEEEGPEQREPGYLWTFSEQEERLPDEFGQHMEILDEMEVGEVLDLNLDRASDYIRWAAAQALDEQGWTSQAVDVLRRIGVSGAPHPALCYPEILLRLHDLLRERGDYEEALAILERVERDDPDRRDACRERRAEVLILTGQVEEGLRLFEKAVRAIPDDPWIPLTAAWALIRAGDYDGAVGWIARGERAARRIEDEEEIRTVEGELERLRNEARIRRERRDRGAAQAQPGPSAAPDDPAAREQAAGGPGTTGGGRGASGAPAAAAGSGAAGPGPAPHARPEEIREAILAELDAEEVRLTRTPPRGEPERQSAIERLGALHRRASAAWDDAVERHDEPAIAALDDLQWEVVEVAERFGLKLPGVED
jgi:tetratricopeptide (TPR) repeat protein